MEKYTHFFMWTIVKAFDIYNPYFCDLWGHLEAKEGYVKISNNAI